MKSNPLECPQLFNGYIGTTVCTGNHCLPRLRNTEQNATKLWIKKSSK